MQTVASALGHVETLPFFSARLQIHHIQSKVLKKLDVYGFSQPNVRFTHHVNRARALAIVAFVIDEKDASDSLEVMAKRLDEWAWSET